MLRSTIIIVSTLLLVACDGELLETLDDRLRKDDSRRAHAATFLAVGATQKAHGVARAMSRMPHANCQRRAPLENRFELRVERRRGDSTEVWHREVRTYTRDGVRARVDMKGRFETRWGARGAFHNAIATDGDEYFVRDDESELWYRSRAAKGVIAPEGLGGMQVLIDAVGGWRRGRDQWHRGDSALRCEHRTSQSSRAWLSRLEGRGDVVEASFEHVADEKTRSFRGLWQLEMGYELIVTASESWSYESAGDMLMPKQEEIVDVERERDLYRAQREMESLAAQEFIESEGKE